MIREGEKEIVPESPYGSTPALEVKAMLFERMEKFLQGVRIEPLGQEDESEDEDSLETLELDETESRLQESLYKLADNHKQLIAEINIGKARGGDLSALESKVVNVLDEILMQLTDFESADKVFESLDDQTKFYIRNVLKDFIPDQEKIKNSFPRADLARRDVEQSKNKIEVVFENLDGLVRSSEEIDFLRKDRDFQQALSQAVDCYMGQVGGLAANLKEKREWYERVLREF